MGLDAFVPCRCLADGLVGDPPVDWSLLEFDEGRLCVREDESDDDEFDEKAFDEWCELDKNLEAWMEVCCAHPGMRQADEWVGNWPMVRIFQAYARRLTDVSHGKYSTLSNLIPQGNYGAVEPEDVATALVELDLLLELAVGSTTWFLADAQTGLEVYDYNPTLGGRWGQGPGIAWGFDPHGVFVERDGVEVFRAMRVKQRIVGKDGNIPIVLFSAEDGQTYIESGIGFGQENREWKVVSRPLVEGDIPCIDALRRLFRASVEARNPVFWT